MTDADGNAPESYRASLVGLASQNLKELQTLAESRGTTKEFTLAVERIWHRVQTDPWGFGELVQSIPSLELAVHVASSPPLTVRFGIHEKKKLVFVVRYL